jgi:hypothetical protein
MTFVRGQVRRIHVIQRTPRDQPRFQQRTQIGKYQILETLFRGIIEKNCP